MIVLLTVLVIGWTVAAALGGLWWLLRQFRRLYVIVPRDRMVEASTPDGERLLFVCAGVTPEAIKQTQQLVAAALAPPV